MRIWLTDSFHHNFYNKKGKIFLVMRFHGKSHFLTGKGNALNPIFFLDFGTQNGRTYGKIS